MGSTLDACVVLRREPQMNLDNLRPKDRRQVKRKQLGRRGIDRKWKTNFNIPQAIFSILLFAAYVLVARPAGEHKISLENGRLENSDSELKVSVEKPLKAKKVAKKKKAHMKVAKKPKVKVISGPNVYTYTPPSAYEEPIVVTESIKASTADAAKGRKPTSVVPFMARPEPEETGDSDFDIKDDFAVNIKSK